MTVDDLKKFFYEYGETDEPHKFDRIPVKFSKRDDLHAFILLDKIMPDGHTIISAAEHDEIYLDVDIEELAKIITKDQILELVRCGVSFDGYNDCLYMFV